MEGDNTAREALVLQGEGYPSGRVSFAGGERLPSVGQSNGAGHGDGAVGVAAAEKGVASPVKKSRWLLGGTAGLGTGLGVFDGDCKRLLLPFGTVMKIVARRIYTDSARGDKAFHSDGSLFWLLHDKGVISGDAIVAGGAVLIRAV